MNHSLFLYLIGAILVLTLIAAPVAADTPTISGISPSEGYNSGTSWVTITGSNFNLTSSLGTVVLMKSGETNITASVSSMSSTSLTCSFPLSGRTAGTWDVIVVNQDNSEYVRPSFCTAGPARYWPRKAKRAATTKAIAGTQAMRRRRPD